MKLTGPAMVEWAVQLKQMAGAGAARGSALMLHFSENQIHNPAATDVRTWPAAVVQDAPIVTPGFL